jgi:hypothetical protein
MRFQGSEDFQQNVHHFMGMKDMRHSQMVHVEFHAVYGAYCLMVFLYSAISDSNLVSHQRWLCSLEEQLRSWQYEKSNLRTKSELFIRQHGR